MKIELIRLTSNNLYTEGQILVNGANFSHTLEHTFSMLPIGEYKVELQKVSKSHRVIAILPHLATHSTLNTKHLAIIDHGNTWKDSLARKCILIGTPVIPGAIKCSQTSYGLLFERLKKCKTPVTLLIRDDQCKENNPIAHWLM